MQSGALLQQFPIISDQLDKCELKVILYELEKTLKKSVDGAIVEFGCYAGTASLFIARTLKIASPNRSFHVYDSFQGLPEKSAKDQSPAGTQFTVGSLASSKQAFIANFKKAGLVLPVVHKSWFSDLTPHEVPQQISFAFLDGDYYQSILESLRLIWHRLSPGAVVIIDDYQNEALPGASKAVDEWLKTHAVARFRVESSLAVLTLQ